MSSEPVPSAVAATPSLVRRAVYCHEMLRLAERLRRLGTDVGRAESVVVLDAASESLLKVILDNAEEPPGRGGTRAPSFAELTGRVAALKMSPSRTKSDLEHLHRVRNVVQHETTPVASSEVDGLHADVSTLLADLTRIHLSLDLHAVSISSLFTDRVVQTLYRGAESRHSEGRLEESAILLVAAFEKARFEEQQRLWGSMITWAMLDENEESGSRSADFGALRGYVRRLHEEVEVLKLRLDYKQYRKFCEIAPTMLTSHFGENLPDSPEVEAWIQYWTNRLTSDELANSVFKERLRAGDWLPFAFGFVSNAVMTWQQESRKGIFELLAEEGSDTSLDGTPREL